MSLAEEVVQEADRNLDHHGAAWARYVFNLRRQQLSKMNPRFFGDRGLKC